MTNITEIFSFIIFLLFLCFLILFSIPYAVKKETKNIKKKIISRFFPFPLGIINVFFNFPKPYSHAPNILMNLFMGVTKYRHPFSFYRHPLKIMYLPLEFKKLQNYHWT